MLWWSSNVGDRVSNMQQTEIFDPGDEVNNTSSNENKTIKGNVEIFTNWKKWGNYYTNTISSKVYNYLLYNPNSMVQRRSRHVVQW